MAERSLISLGTYKKTEAGNPSVVFGFWLQTLFQLGLMEQVSQATAPHTDKLGEVLRAEQSPPRVRTPSKELSRPSGPLIQGKDRQLGWVHLARKASNQRTHPGPAH
jgi:hypothetical protein